MIPISENESAPANRNRQHLNKMANPNNIRYNPNGPLPECDCDHINCWICHERQHLANFKKCDECGHNRMYWENEQEKAEKEDRLDDVEICWKCVMCGICGDGPASTGIVCRKKKCKKERSRLIPCDGCGMRYAPESYKQKGTCPKCVKLFAEMD